MRIRLATLLVNFSVTVVVASPLPTAENASLTGVEQEVWALEETYAAAFRDAKHDVIISLLHRDFLGWSLSRERPGEKGDVPGFLQKHYPKPLDVSVRIDRAGIRISGDAVNTHYLLKLTGKDGQVKAIRMTHTWIKEGVDWKILGGMSSKQQPNSPGEKAPGNA